MRHCLKIFFHHPLILLSVEGGLFFVKAVNTVVVTVEEPVASLAFLLQTVLFAIVLIKDFEVAAIVTPVAVARTVGNIDAVLKELVLDGTVSDTPLTHTAIECASVSYAKHLNTLMQYVDEHVSPPLLKLAQLLLRHLRPTLLHCTQDL